jgi:pectate lyase
MNHDKTMLICSGSSDTAWKTITLCRNYYYNLGQRQPLVGYSMIHIYNNYYAYDGKAPYKYQATIAARYDFKLIVENNNFGYGGISSSTNPVGICFTSGNTGGSNALGASEKKPFDIPYPYGLLSAANAKAKCLENSGAGKVTVEKND